MSLTDPINGDNTLTRPLIEMIKWGFVIRQQNVVDCIQDYWNNKNKMGTNVRVPIGILHSRIVALFFTLQPLLKRTLTPEQYEGLKLLVRETKDYDKLETAFIILNELLDAKQITRVDNVIAGSVMGQ